MLSFVLQDFLFSVCWIIHEFLVQIEAIRRVLWIGTQWIIIDDPLSHQGIRKDDVAISVEEKRDAISKLIEIITQILVKQAELYKVADEH